MPHTFILDLDGSVAGLEAATRLPLRDWEERIRFGCSMSDLERLRRALEPQLGDEPAVSFLGSGDFHHLTFPLLQRRPEEQSLEVVVFDNHPDNMLVPFGIHCGSWVAHVARLPFVSRVHVAGITSTDVEGLHALENHVASLRSGKVRYWCIGRRLGALRGLGVKTSQSFESASSMLDALDRCLAETSGPVYLSIDKDVLAPDVVQTNWDQGVMRLEELQSAVERLQPRLAGADVVGEVSFYRYRSRFKRLLTRLDGQPSIDPASLDALQEAHRVVNQRLLRLLSPPPRSG